MVSIVNSGQSKAPLIMELVRKLVLLSMEHNFLVRAHHVPGVSNEITDALSRFQMQRFWAFAPDSLYHPPFPNDPLREEVLTYASWRFPRTQIEPTAAGKKLFLQFCLINRLLGPKGDVLPASEGTFIYFASYLARTVFGSCSQPPYYCWVT